MNTSVIAVYKAKKSKPTLDGVG